MASTHLYCSSCGAANQAQDTYCFACGRPLRNTSSIQYPTLTSANSTQTGLLTFNHLLKQRYRILDQLGKGGFGAVYKAEDIQFGNRLVAVKEMSQSGLSSQEINEAAKAFEREAFMLANLRHQNLPRIYDHFSDGGRWYLVMDFIEGETLAEHLNKARGYLSLDEVLQIGIQLCTVLDYLHTRHPPIIFRDLTAANIMLTPDGHVYLIDFGIARLFKPGQTKDTTAFGSPGYASPEQYGNTQTTPQSDVYSLGATLHYMLTAVDPSQKPFRFTPPQQLRHDIPLNLSTLIMQMLGMDASKRPASMTIIKQALQQIASQLSGKTPLPTTRFVRGTPLPPIQHTSGKKGIFTIAGAAIAVILVVTFIILAVSTHSGQSPSQVTLNNSSATASSTSSGAASPTLAPTPTPSPDHSPGTVLYSTNDFSSWTGTSDWKVLNGILLNDGTRDHSQPPYGPTIAAPSSLDGINDYAVEARIQVSGTQSSGYEPCFGINVRGNPAGDSWQGYYIGIGCDSNLSTAIITNVNTIDSYIKETQVNPGTTLHTYRVEVKGNTIKFLIDGGLILEAVDNTYLTGSQVGFFCYSTQLSVSSFKVIAL